MAERLAQVQALQGQVVAESASKQDKFEKKRPVAAARARGAPARPGQQLPGTQRPGGPGHARRRRQEVRARRRLHRGHRPGGGKRVLISASDSAVKGGTVAPMGLKKGLRAQELRAEQAAAGLAGRIGRRQPDVPGRHFHRRRAQLCQPGAPVGRGHSADRRGAWFVHGGRGLPAGPVGLCGAGEGPLQHLPGRPAAGEGRHWRGHHRRGTGRQRDCTPA
jgi:hypothetical protein